MLNTDAAHCSRSETLDLMHQHPRWAQTLAYASPADEASVEARMTACVTPRALRLSTLFKQSSRLFQQNGHGY